MLDQHEGQADLNRVTRELGCEGQVSSICSAVIYDYMFQSVRLLLRKGFGDDEIQRFFDYELGRIGSVDTGTNMTNVEIDNDENEHDIDFFDQKFG